MAKKNEINELYVYRLISKNVKRLRTVFQMSQMDLAASTGLTHNFINDIENCKKGISAKTIAKLSVAFNVEPHQFFLPEILPNSEVFLYMKDYNDSLQKIVGEHVQQYLAGNKKSK